MNTAGERIRRVVIIAVQAEAVADFPLQAAADRGREQVALAALAAADRGCSVLLLERNAKVGRKLYITGKGRCNVANDLTEALAEVFPAVRRGRSRQSNKEVPLDASEDHFEMQ